MIFSKVNPLMVLMTMLRVGLTMKMMWTMIYGCGARAHPAVMQPSILFLRTTYHVGCNHQSLYSAPPHQKKNNLKYSGELKKLYNQLCKFGDCSMYILTCQCITNKLAKQRRCVSRVHFAKYTLEIVWKLLVIAFRKYITSCGLRTLFNGPKTPKQEIWKCDLLTDIATNLLQYCARGDAYTSKNISFYLMFRSYCQISCCRTSHKSQDSGIR